MSPAGYIQSDWENYIWKLNSKGYFTSAKVNLGAVFRPVINLKSSVTVTGSGASDDHWVVAN